MSNNKVTIYDVASRSNVSLATVSRVLNSPEKVKPETKKRVLDVINEIGYRPNAIARGLASQKSTTVALIVSDASRSSVSEMINGISDIARKYNYTVLLTVTYAEEEINSEAWKQMLASQVDGIIYINDDIPAEQSEYINDLHIPVVLCSSISEEKEIPSVVIDYEDASYEMTKSLANKNLKNIAFITSQKNRSISKLREEGYHKAIKEFGLEPQVLRFSGGLDEYFAHYRDYLQNNKVDGVVAARDTLAIQFLNAATSLGINVPNDIQIMGSQNTKQSRMCYPTLSTVNSPVYDIGAVAMRLLTKLMNQEEIEEKNVVLPYDMIWRGTTKKPD